MSDMSDQSIDSLPLVIAGPILRRTESDAVTVWLALSRQANVSLTVYQTQGGILISQPLLEGTASTITLGKRLHLVAVTAKPIATPLQPGEIYAYNLTFDRDIQLEAALSPHSHIPVHLSYFDHGLPTFVTPPQDVNHLKIIHGSCRKPHGGDFDALPLLDDMIDYWACQPHQRPQQLFLTGDQIYGDDVADSLLAMAMAAAKILFDWTEILPLGDGRSILPAHMPPGTRSPIAENEAGFTAMLHGKPDKAKSHLFSFLEYCAIYLLAWSEVLWQVPAVKAQLDTALPNQEVAAVHSFSQDLIKVRRSLANISTYTICDDHDVTDDWYLNRQWCDRVLSKPLGRRVVQNGILAYALFQGWGNTPQQFEDGKFLGVVQQWLASNATDVSAEQAIAAYLSIPSQQPQTGLPEYDLDEDVLILKRLPQALSWNYTITSSSHQVIVLDTRTWRGYPQTQGITPPMLLCPRAFQQQLEKPLQTNSDLLTILVLPTNIVTVSLVDVLQRWDLHQEKVFSKDVGDSWNFNESALAKLLQTLAQWRNQVVVLTGDIHYSSAIHLRYANISQSSYLDLVQLTSSALKNAEWSTYLIHTKIKSLLPEKDATWVGWHSDAELVEKIITPEGIKQYQLSHGGDSRPDSPPSQRWHKFPLRLGYDELSWEIMPADNSNPEQYYHLQWIPRQPSQAVVWQKPQPGVASVQGQFFSQLLSKLWRNRWLQEGKEVIGRNNLSLVKFSNKDKLPIGVLQETYWHPPWQPLTIVQSCFEK